MLFLAPAISMLGADPELIMGPMDGAMSSEKATMVSIYGGARAYVACTLIRASF